MVRKTPCLKYERMKARQIDLLRERRAVRLILNHIRPIEREELEALRGFCVPIEKIRQLISS